MIQSLWDWSRAFRLVINLLRYAQGRMTAAATTGPANGPRPASSTPATSVNSRDQRLRSNSRRSVVLKVVLVFKSLDQTMRDYNDARCVV